MQVARENTCWTMRLKPPEIISALKTDINTHVHNLWDADPPLKCDADDFGLKKLPE